MGRTPPPQPTHQVPSSPLQALVVRLVREQVKVKMSQEVKHQGIFQPEKHRGLCPPVGAAQSSLRRTGGLGQLPSRGEKRLLVYLVVTLTGTPWIHRNRVSLPTSCKRLYPPV